MSAAAEIAAVISRTPKCIARRNLIGQVHFTQDERFQLHRLLNGALAALVWRSPVSRSSKNSAWNEVVAIILLGVGTLLFLALVSYNPKDLPSRVPWSYLSPPNRPAQNFIGPLGAIFASIFYFVIGAASYLLAAVLLGFGAAKLFHPSLRAWRRIPWITLFIASGACLDQLLRIS